ncbi:MAG: hypothetical protein AAGJ52_13390 [Pseudomonadota bacterium]
MKKTLMCLILGLVLSAAASAQVSIELDGETVVGIERIVYDAGSARLTVELIGSRPCVGLVVPPPVGQVGLILGNNTHALAQAVVYTADPLAPSLGLVSQIGTLQCESEAIFFDRFEGAG